jgi:polysaccharide pyruvyl transferase WcaK-like protein
LNRLDWIFARDGSSYNCSKKLKLEGKTTQVIDVAFALPYTKKEFEGDKLRIGLNVSGLLYHGGFKGDNYFDLSFSYKEFVSRLIEDLLKNDNYEVHLIGHVITKTAGVDDDYSVCEELYREYTDCILAPRFSSPIEAKGYIAGMDLLSGARMHATIAAFSSGVPVIPIAYSRKFNGLYNTLNYPYLIDAKSGISCDDALALFDRYSQNIDSMKENIRESEKIYLREIEKYKHKLAELLEV